MYILNDRAIIEIAGTERQDFLQGLITNDIGLVDQKNIIYSFFLNANGRYFADFFIISIADKYWLDCHESQIDNIIAKLNLFKLRSKVIINKLNSVIVIFNNIKQGFLDPRIPNFGYRDYVSKDISFKYPIDANFNYHLKRFENNLVEGCYDLSIDKSFPLEFGFDNFNAISYKKGCYIGQETTARTHYRGQIRKKIVKFKINKLTNNFDEFVLNFNNDKQIIFQKTNFWDVANLKNCIIHQDDQEIGIILSTFYDRNANSLIGLALLKDNSKNDESLNYENQDNLELVFFNNKISII